MRTILVRSLQSVLAFASVALLTGANDAGCGLGTVIGGDGSGGSGTTVSVGSGTVDPTGPIACPSGTVVQLVCNPSPSGGGGVPIGGCMGPNCPPPPPPCNPSDPNCSVPFPGDDDVPPPPPCNPSDPNCSSPGNPPPCDPADPHCTSPYPGDPPPPPCDPADPDCSSPPFPGEPPTPCDPADSNCVPPLPCEPGGGECPPPPPPPGCSYECVPAGQVCPPGSDLITVCVDGGSASEGTAGGSPSIPPGGPDTPVSNVSCWTECAPHGCGGSEPGEPGEPSNPSEPKPD